MSMPCHLQTNNADPTTPLAAYYENNKLHLVSPADITSMLHSSTAFIGPLVGFLPKDISTCSL